MEKAAFKLDNYRFTKASLDFNIPNNAELNISFSPKGVFHTKEARYELDFDVMVGCTETNTEVVRFRVWLRFHLAVALLLPTFPNTSTLTVLPSYFHTSGLCKHNNLAG